MYKLDLSKSQAWTNFIIAHANKNLVEASDRLRASQNDAGIIDTNYFKNNFEVVFENKERAVEFLLRWS